VTVVASENGYMLSVVDDYEKGDERINVEEVVVRAFGRSPPCLAEGPRLVVEKMIYINHVLMRAHIHIKIPAAVWQTTWWAGESRDASRR
jgi:hypothetical protein